MATILQTTFSKCTFIDTKFGNSIRISLEFVPEGIIDNKSPLFRVMAFISGNAIKRLSWLVTFHDNRQQITVSGVSNFHPTVPIVHDKNL